MNAEIQVMVSVGGRPLWVKKQMIPAELTAKLSDKAYDKVVASAARQLEETCRLGTESSSQARDPQQDSNQRKPASPVPSQGKKR